MDLQGKAAIVTGGGSGIGAECARTLAAKGMKVAVMDVNMAGARAVAEECGGIAIECDVTSSDSAVAAVAAAREANGIAQLLINCAGIGTPGRIVSRSGPLPLEDYEAVIKVNLIGTFNMIRLAAADMMAMEPNGEGERGVIVNTGSTSAYEGQIGQTAYAASKGGVVGMAIALAREFARDGIRVMTISPGPFDTPLFGAMPANAHQRLLDAAQFPGRAGKPAEYGQLVVSIVENPMLNGESIRLDGALRMGPR